MMKKIKKILNKIKSRKKIKKYKRIIEDNKNIIAFILIGLCIITTLLITEEIKEIKESNKKPYIPELEIIIEEKIYEEYDGIFELPINGATGYASIGINLYETNDTNSTILKTLEPGTGFAIIEEIEGWWKVKTEEDEGYVLHKNCFINLPDVLPSIIYNITNSEKSLFKSSYIDIPEVTGEKLYDTYLYNERLNKSEYAAPVLYSMAKKIASIQKQARENGDTLVIYETFRPWFTQMKVATNTINLMNSNPTVANGINESPWYTDWFIGTTTSNHQKGFAIDVSLAQITETKEKTTGDYKYTIVTKYTEYQMPTQMHELSVKAAKYVIPVSVSSRDAWRYATYRDTMTDGAKKLHDYCTNNGLTPLSSEWWHFNDWDSYSNENGDGKFYITSIYSAEPKKVQ